MHFQPWSRFGGGWRRVAAMVLQMGMVLAEAEAVRGDIQIRRVEHELRLAGDVAEVVSVLDLESSSRATASVLVLEGEVALVPGRLPSGVELRREGEQIWLCAERRGAFQVRLEFFSRVQSKGAWRETRFRGPVSVITGLEIVKDDPGAEVVVLSGMPVSAGADGGAGQRIALGEEREVVARWQDRAETVARQAVLSCETTSRVRVTSTALQWESDLCYDVRQGVASVLRVALPAEQVLMKVEGERIRDWRIEIEEGRQVLEVELVRAIEGGYRLRLLTERGIGELPWHQAITVPEPLQVDRESGRLVLLSDELELVATPGVGLRQVNALPPAQAAYAFHGRPCSLDLELRLLEAELSVEDRVAVRVEDTRLLVEHAAVVTVRKAGVYALDWGPLGGLTVTGVEGEGVADWQVRDDGLRVNLANRLLGHGTFRVRLERPWRVVPERVRIPALPVRSALRESSQVGVTPAPGIQVKTLGLEGVREVPLSRLAQGQDASLAYWAAVGAWSLELSTERLSPRVVADVFNLITLGEGAVGGSATVRYAILHQGVQELRLRLPERWRNVEFTGPGIRRKDRDGDVWTITLQDKAWGGYTLVITYDQPLENGSTDLTLGGLTTLETEREAGTFALTGAGGVELQELSLKGGLQRIDETELADVDRALTTRSVLLAYRYTRQEEPCRLVMQARRLAAASLLAAVADRTQLTTVLTEDGQMLTQAAFMVKNHDKQFQSFRLPPRARVWSAFVNGEPVQVEQDGVFLLVPLPRGVNRDQAFAVELVYAEEMASLRGWRPRRLALTAPGTDIQTTYAEWELYLPTSHALRGLTGTMQAAPGTTYGLGDAWSEFADTYRNLFRHAGTMLALMVVVGLFALLTWAVVRRGVQGLAGLLAVGAVLVVLTGMLLPALSKAKAKAKTIVAINNLKQIGMAAQHYAAGNGDELPASFEDMREQLGNDAVTVDPATGRQFVFLGGAVTAEDSASAILAYAPEPTEETRAVLLRDGSVQILREEEFAVRLQSVLSGLESHAGTQVPGAGGGQSVQSGSESAVQGAWDRLPMALGLRPIRIELPRAGHRMGFTKVLNVEREALGVAARVVSVRVWNTLRGLGQCSLFLGGAAGLLYLARRRSSNSFAVTVALSLACAGSVWFLVSIRWLGAVLIVAVPLAGVALVLALLRRWRRRPAAQSGADAEQSEAVEGLGGSAVVLWLTALGCAGVLGSVRAVALPPLGATEAQGAPLVSAVYDGDLRGAVAEIGGVFQFGEGEGGRLPLLGPGVAIREFEADSRDVRLVREGGMVGVELPARRETTVRLSFVVRLSGDAGERRLAFDIAPALSTRVRLHLGESDANVTMPDAVWWKTEAGDGGTQVEARLGAADRVVVTWSPRVKRAADVTTTAFCENTQRVLLGGGGVNLHALLAYQVTQGELRQLRVRLPAGHRVLRVEGDRIRNWQVRIVPAEGGGAVMEVLEVNLLEPVTEAYRLGVETEGSLGPIPTGWEMPDFRVLGVKREWGWVGIAVDDEMEVVVEEEEGLRKVDLGEFDALSLGDVVAAYRFPRPDYRLRVRVIPLQPRIEVDLRQVLHVDVEELGLETRLDYRVERVGVFELQVELPDGYRVLRVEWADGRPEPCLWTEHEVAGAGARRLEVSLPQRTAGQFSLVVHLSQLIPELPEELSVPGLIPLGAAKITGHVAVVTEPGVQVKTREFEGVTEVPVAQIAGVNVGLGFRLVPRTAGTFTPWRLTLGVERVASWRRAEVVHWVTVGEGMVQGRTVVRFEIQNAPTREFALRIPSLLKNVEVHGVGLRRRDREEDRVQLELQHKVQGYQEFIVTWDRAMPIEAGGAAYELPWSGVVALDVERETGYVAVATQTQVELGLDQGGGDLMRVDIADLPAWCGRSDGKVAMAWRYLRPDFEAVLTVKRYAAAAMLQALITDARLTTVVAADGQMMTEMALAVRNNGRQFLAVSLPPGAELWAAFVNGQPVQPGRSGDDLLLPLERSLEGDQAIPVQLTYVSVGAFPARRGEVELASPSLDVPLKNAQWELYLPANYTYNRFDGTMNREAGATKILGAFSLAEYSQAESQQRRSLRRQFSNSVVDVRNKLASGRLEDASKAYGNARRYGLKAEMQQLEEEFSKVQSSNLLRAQQTLLANEGVRSGEDYDAAVAEQQWVKLQQAQEVSNSAVRPLRVNLPTRGLRYAFAQALQTRTGEPLTVRFAAVNGEAPAWWRRWGVLLLVFLVLWAGTAWCLGSWKPSGPAGYLAAARK